ncbi:MAG: M48 family metallopeptidase [Gemmatimonadota bacterium]|jgi:predicted Zn-dependent protease
MMRLCCSRRVLATGLVAGSAALAACGLTQQQEIRMGRQYAAEVDRQLPIVEDPRIHRYINALGDRIQQRPGNRDIPYTYHVVNSDEVNAFALPGGFVYINRGLIEATDDLSELAGVLAHEIGHVEARHGAEMAGRQQAAQLGLLVGSVLLGGPPDGVAGGAVNLGAQAYFAHHGREAEAEADALAVRLLTRAGIHPGGLVRFFEELLEDRNRTPSAPEQWFSTHPLTEERIAHVRDLIRGLPPDQLRALEVTSAGFVEFRARVSRLPRPPSGMRR